MDKKYWEEYYKKKAVPKESSLFAKFVMKDYVKPGQNLMELGCGNGRDSIYFFNNGVSVEAVDQCRPEMESLGNENPNISFVCGDFTNMPLVSKKYDHVYSRFTLHSITKEEEERVLSWVKDSLHEGGHFLIEARGHKNELFGRGEQSEEDPDIFEYDNHHRRFIDLLSFENKLRNLGFEIVYSEEKKGFSPFGGEDQVFVRIVARK